MFCHDEDGTTTPQCAGWPVRCRTCEWLMMSGAEVTVTQPASRSLFHSRFAEAADNLQISPQLSCSNMLLHLQHAAQLQNVVQNSTDILHDRSRGGSGWTRTPEATCSVCRAAVCPLERTPEDRSACRPVLCSVRFRALSPNGTKL